MNRKKAAHVKNQASSGVDDGALFDAEAAYADSNPRIPPDPRRWQPLDILRMESASSVFIGSPVQKRLDLLNQAIEQVTEAVFVIGLDRKIQFVNPAMETIFGKATRELAGGGTLYTENAARTGPRGNLGAT